MRIQEPHLTVRYLQPLVAALQALGHPVDDILTAAKISHALLQNADGRVPHSSMMRFWQRARDLTGDDHLGIHLAEAAPIPSFEVHAYAMLSSPNLREAYRRACRYQRLIHEATDLTFDESADEGVLRHALPGGKPVPRPPAEFLVTLWVRIGRLVAGDDWSPSLICFAHQEPADIKEHVRVFRAPLRFSSGLTAMHVPNFVLDTPNPREDASLAGLLDRYAEGLLKQLPRRPNFSERVRAALLKELQGGAPTVTAIAKTLHVSPRSLHRGLHNEGTSFRELLEQLRHERATALLANPACSVAEVGFLLGFAELSSFSRAFKRWTGRAPAAFRARVLAASSNLTRPNNQ